MKYLIYGITLCAVVAFASLRGGRYERRAAITFLAGWVASQAIYLMLRGELMSGALAAVDLSILGSFVWLRLRHAAPWLSVQVGIQATVIPVTTAMILFRGAWVSHAVLEPSLTILSYLQLAALAWAVARRQWGPPHQPPASV